MNLNVILQLYHLIYEVYRENGMFCVFKKEIETLPQTQIF